MKAALQVGRHTTTTPPPSNTAITLRQCRTAATIDVIGEDLLHNIISRLPATSFASAACVSRSFKLVCDRLLCRPKLSSACSLCPSLQDGHNAGMTAVVEKMDYAMSSETIIVGDLFSLFQYKNDIHDNYAAVALLFAVEKNKPPGIGETKFHAVLASGLSPVGPTYKAAYVRKNTTWIAARREGSHENIDGETLLNQVYDALGERIPRRDLYIAVTKKNAPLVKKRSDV